VGRRGGTARGSAEKGVGAPGFAGQLPDIGWGLRSSGEDSAQPHQEALVRCRGMHMTGSPTVGRLPGLPCGAKAGQPAIAMEVLHGQCH
jgi:hypothetical protein